MQHWLGVYSPGFHASSTRLGEQASRSCSKGDFAGAYGEMNAALGTPEKVPV
jgi:hypothetical protein